MFIIMDFVKLLPLYAVYSGHLLVNQKLGTTITIVNGNFKPKVIFWFFSKTVILNNRT